MKRLALLIAMLGATAHAAPSGRTTVVSLLGDELLAPGAASKVDADVVFPATAPRKASLNLSVRCAGRCGERPRRLSVRVVDGTREIEIARLQPPKNGGTAALDLSQHASLFKGSRTVRVLVDSLQSSEKSGWRVDATLTLEAPAAPKKAPGDRVASR